MDSIVIPASEAVFGAVSSEAGPNGDVEKVPKNDAEWQAVRRQALMLIEGGNLLMIEGRHVAPASAKSEHPGVELEPAQMDALMAKNKAAFTKAASGLIDTALVALKAIDAKNPMALSDAGGDIDDGNGIPAGAALLDPHGAVVGRVDVAAVGRQDHFVRMLPHGHAGGQLPVRLVEAERAFGLVQDEQLAPRRWSGRIGYGGQPEDHEDSLDHWRLHRVYRVPRP